METKKNFRNEWLRFFAFQKNIMIYDLFDDDINKTMIGFSSNKCREFRYFNNMIYPLKYNNKIRVNIIKPSPRSREIIMDIEFLED